MAPSKTHVAAGPSATTPLLQAREEPSGDLENGASFGHVPSYGATEGVKATTGGGVNGTKGYGTTTFRSRIPAGPPGVESLDYEIVESAVYKEDWRTRTWQDQILYVVMKWVFVLLIGIGTGLVAFGINMSVENLAGLKYRTTLFFTHQNLQFMGFLVFAGWNVLLVFFSASLCVFISPAAAGSGIPEVKAYLNGINSPNILSINTLFVKVFGSVGSVGAGLAVGKEGPLVHVGSCIAALLGQGGSRRYHLTWKGLRMFKNDRDRRDLVTCGAAAGVAAAFRSPLGGVLFALEEATSWWRSPLLWRAFFTNAVVAVVLRTAMAWCQDGRCGSFGGGGFIIFDEFEFKTEYGLLELLPMTFLGVLGGLLGSLFIKINLKICEFRIARINSVGPWMKVLEACLIATLTSFLQFTIPYTAKCQPCPAPSGSAHITCPNQNWIGNFKNFNCPAGQYNDLASLMFNTNDDAIRNLFSGGTDNEFSYATLLTFSFTEFFLAACTYGIAVPSGLFVPTILCGATYGRIVGRFMNHFTNKNYVNEGTYALLGAASFLGGAMRMTVSLCIILLELTGNLSMLPLIMLVLLVSKTVGDFFTEGVYDTHLHFRNVPLLEAQPENFMKKLSAHDAITKPPVTLAGVEKVGHILQVLEETTHNAYPVIDPASDAPNDAGLYGLILRSHILVLLKNKTLFQEAPTRQDGPHIHHTHSLSYLDFGKPGSGKDLRIEDVRVSDEEKEMFLDLHPFINASPYTVAEGMSLSKVYTLFRTLGLRHLCVVPKAQSILGVLTRKDLVPEHLEKRLEEIEAKEASHSSTSFVRGMSINAR